MSLTKKLPAVSISKLANGDTMVEIKAMDLVGRGRGKNEAEEATPEETLAEDVTHKGVPPGDALKGNGEIHVEKENLSHGAKNVEQSQKNPHIPVEPPTTSAKFRKNAASEKADNCENNTESTVVKKAKDNSAQKDKLKSGENCTTAEREQQLAARVEALSKNIRYCQTQLRVANAKKRCYKANALDRRIFGALVEYKLKEIRMSCDNERLRRDVETLKTDLKRTTGDLQNLERKNSQKAKEYEELQEKLKSAQSLGFWYRDTINRINEGVRDVSLKVLNRNELANEFSNAVSKYKRYKQMYFELQKRLNGSLQIDVSDTEDSDPSTEDLIKTHIERSQEEGREQQVENLRAELAVKSSKIDELRKELEDSLKSKHDVELQWDKAQFEIASLLSVVAKAHEQVDQYRKISQKAEIEIKTMQNIHHSFMQTSNNEKKELEATVSNLNAEQLKLKNEFAQLKSNFLKVHEEFCRINKTALQTLMNNNDESLLLLHNFKKGFEDRQNNLNSLETSLNCVNLCCEENSPTTMQQLVGVDSPLLNLDLQNDTVSHCPHPPSGIDVTNLQYGSLNSHKRPYFNTSDSSTSCKEDEPDNPKRKCTSTQW